MTRFYAHVWNEFVSENAFIRIAECVLNLSDDFVRFVPILKFINKPLSGLFDRSYFAYEINSESRYGFITYPQTKIGQTETFFQIGTFAKIQRVKKCNK